MALHDEYDIQVNAGTASRRHALNMIPGSGVNISISDNSANDRSDVTIATASAADYAPTGLTGATAPSRYVGATTSGAPTSGTFAVGDYIVDQTGAIWICTTAGGPGTWKEGAVSLDSTASDIQPLGIAAGAGNKGLAADAGHVHPAPNFVAADQGLIAWNYDPIFATNGLVTTAGTLYLMKLPIRSACTVSNVWISLTGTVAAGASSGSYVGLYNSSGTLLVGSADIGTSLTSGVGNKQLALSTSQALSAGTFIWVSLLTNLATTQPTVISTLTFSGSPRININLAVASSRFAANGTGITSLPSSITPSSNSQTPATSYWIGVS